MASTGERIRAAREAAGLSQRGLADAVGVSRPTVSMWESGEIRSLSAEHLLRLAERFRRSPEWILYGREGRAAERAPVTPELIAAVQRLDADAQVSLLAFLRQVTGGGSAG
ncbi:helix-turn-helix transcriptional regulator [Endothiovibrio diazotrophicus]